MSRGLAVAAALVAAALWGGAPWWAGFVALGMAAWPGTLGPAIGGAALFGGLPWPWVFALVLLPPSGRNRALAALAFGAFVVYALRQVFLAERFGMAMALTTGGLAAMLGAACGAWLVGAERVYRVGLALAGVVLCGRTVALWSVDGGARLVAAQRLHAETLVYPGLVRDPTLAEALVHAVPDRDEAALLLGWEAALEAGWRPKRAEGHVVEVARWLESHGRGGEALRLLARHPREGEVDAWRSLFERTQGHKVGWRGATLGTQLSGMDPRDLWMVTDGYHEELVTTGEGTLVLFATGQAFEGPPTVRVRLDADPERRVTLDGPTEIVLGPVSPGPHRVQVWFDSDRVGALGDRQVHLTGLAVR